MQGVKPSVLLVMRLHAECFILHIAEASNALTVLKDLPINTLANKAYL